jgi:hypothetical protein
MIDELFKLNCSTIFLLYPLGLCRKDLEETGFINCYLRDPVRPELEEMDTVLLLFNVKNSKERFRYFVEKEKTRTKLFIDEYDHDKNYVVLVYEFPTELKEDLEKFKRGQYSQFSKKFKEFYPETIRVEIPIKGRKQSTTQPSIQYMIVHKDQQWRDILEDPTRGLGVLLDDGQELWSVMDWSDETISIPPRKVAL